jgi:membrane-associated protein
MIEIIFHIDKYLDIVIKNFGNWSYLLLFIIIFGETGLVIAPLLPGDSLLFAVGTFSALGSLNLFWLLIILSAAAIIGDSVNYAFGKFLGKKIIQKGSNRFFKKEYLERTHKFYEKYGGKTIILARFLPIIRTFAPFVAGVGAMSYGKFFIYNVIGGLLWVAIFVLGGYYFGNIPVIRENFFITILVIIAISVVPVVIEFWKHKFSRRS